MSEPARIALAVGDPAPSFTARTAHGETVEGPDRGDRPVLLFFFPFAFTQGCTAELNALRDRYSDFAAVSLYAVSTDPPYALRVFAEAEALPFPLLSDFWPHGQIAQAYGVFDDERGCARRASFLIDTEGALAWSTVVELGQTRDLDEHVTAIAARRPPPNG